ncbi:hypothetical protein J3F83DRAFT_455607 [Trichoderma novae-zelandiae]
MLNQRLQCTRVGLLPEAVLSLLHVLVQAKHPSKSQGPAKDTASLAGLVCWQLGSCSRIGQNPHCLGVHIRAAILLSAIVYRAATRNYMCALSRLQHFGPSKHERTPTGQHSGIMGLPSSQGYPFRHRVHEFSISLGRTLCLVRAESAERLHSTAGSSKAWQGKPSPRAARHEQHWTYLLVPSIHIEVPGQSTWTLTSVQYCLQQAFQRLVTLGLFQ